MTVQQEAIKMIESMPEESVQFIIELIGKMTPEFRGIESNVNKVNVSKRIGLGKGMINDPKGFDDWDDEITNLFENGDL